MNVNTIKQLILVCIFIFILLGIRFTFKLGERSNLSSNSSKIEMYTTDIYNVSNTHTTLARTVTNGIYLEANIEINKDFYTIMCDTSIHKLEQTIAHELGHVVQIRSIDINDSGKQELFAESYSYFILGKSIEHSIILGNNYVVTVLKSKTTAIERLQAKAFLTMHELEPGYRDSIYSIVKEKALYFSTKLK